MASSSDWVAALEALPEPSASALPGWITALAAPGGFVEGLPLARLQPPVPPPTALPAEPAPAHDPVADAYARGEAAGRAAARAEHEAEGAHQRALRLSFHAFDQAALDSLASALAETVTALCAQVIADYVPQPAELLARCEAAAQRLGKAAHEATLHLNPADLALLAPDALDGWAVVADAAIERGGLRFETADGSVSDGPADWRRTIAAAIRS